MERIGDFSSIRAETDAGVAWITIDRPEKRNALSSVVRREITDAVSLVHEDEALRVVVFTGAGDKAFIAGADITEFESRSVEQQRHAMSGVTVFDAVAELSKPTLAMINGFALGGGCELALACDLRIAGRSARLGQPEVNLALLPGGGGTQRLPRIVGRGAATRLILTGEIIDAEEAFRIGLVDYLFEDAELRAETEKIARTMAARSPMALRLIKESMRIADEQPLSAGLMRERELFLEAFGSDDRAEGVSAFLEKRKPEFTGR